ncbi:MAG: ABC transporter ATP-binding protein [Acidimicrobiales bacterium]|jgi:oligopeptide/dipeptide ABC transporter ATP-binding protein
MLRRDAVIVVNSLSIAFPSRAGSGEVVRDVSFSVKAGQRVGLVGESGCGKSMTARAIMQLIPAPGRISAGQVYVGDDPNPATAASAKRWRGTTVAMITQDPLSSLNPLVRIGVQITEMLRYHGHLSRAQARTRAVELLKAVGLPNPHRTMRQFPNVLSGGMRQRVALAIAISCNPRLLIADEPTTALDVTIQAQVLDLLEQMTAEHNSAVLLITHDLGVVANFCEELLVMYAGRIVESGPTGRLIESPEHPYTVALLASVPSMTEELPERLNSIPGSPPVGGVDVRGCAFAPRCQLAQPECFRVEPQLRELGDSTRRVACHAAGMARWPGRLSSKVVS